MQLYDRNEDGLLDLKDMAQLLNLTDNFLLQFNIEVMQAMYSIIYIYPHALGGLGNISECNSTEQTTHQ